MSYLERMLASTRARVAATKELVTEDVLEQRIAGRAAARDLAGSLRGEATAVIAEIKRVSPSAGSLRADIDASKLALAYAEGGAAALSVITEPDHFHGSLGDLEAALVARLPVLRKDFIIDPFQILESRASGADALLLVVRTLGAELGSFIDATTALGMGAFVEVYDESDVEDALAAGASLIGINHRDLESFEVDTQRTAKLAPLLPESCTLVALSGVDTRAQVEELASAGAHAVLVGTNLVTASDPIAKLRELRGVP